MLFRRDTLCSRPVFRFFNDGVARVCYTASMSEKVKKWAAELREEILTLPPKRNKVLFFAWLLLATAYVFIFLMSSAPGNVSDGFSLPLARLFLRDSAHRFDLVHKLIRKCAHIFEFALLFVLWTVFLRALCREDTVKTLHCAALFTLASAAGDEVHQIFVPGRSGQATDVCVDMVGVILLLLLFCRAARRRLKTGTKTERTA